MPVKVKTFEQTDKTDQDVFDMTGNVKEWTLDAYKPYSDILDKHGGDPEKPFRDDPKEAKKAPEGQDLERVVRGGSFLTELAEATTFQRKAEPPTREAMDIGFRVVISCPRIDRVQAKVADSR